MMQSSVNILQELTRSRNHKGQIIHAVGYGSGVISQEEQKNISLPSSRLDAIFVVENSHDFHEKNLRTFPKDYSFELRSMGPEWITRLQKTGGRISYNLLQFENTPVKYGVIEKQDLLDDLLYWKYLYVAGRLQKPHVVLHHIEDPFLEKALTQNLYFAIKVAGILLQDHKYSLQELFTTIASFSYMGDPRLEDPQKIQKISKNISGFQKHYAQEFQRVLEEKFILPVEKNSYITIPETPEIVRNTLPLSLQEELNKTPPETTEQIITHMKRNIKKIVFMPALSQIPKGILTAGIVESLRYAQHKIKKRLL